MPGLLDSFLRELRDAARASAEPAEPKRASQFALPVGCRSEDTAACCPSFNEFTQARPPVGLPGGTPEAIKLSELVQAFRRSIAESKYVELDSQLTNRSLELLTEVPIPAARPNLLANRAAQVNQAAAKTDSSAAVAEISGLLRQTIEGLSAMLTAPTFETCMEQAQERAHGLHSDIDACEAEYKKRTHELDVDRCGKLNVKLKDLLMQLWENTQARLGQLHSAGDAGKKANKLSEQVEGHKVLMQGVINDYEQLKEQSDSEHACVSQSEVQLAAFEESILSEYQGDLQSLKQTSERLKTRQLQLEEVVRTSVKELQKVYGEQAETKHIKEATEATLKYAKKTMTAEKRKLQKKSTELRRTREAARTSCVMLSAANALVLNSAELAKAVRGHWSQSMEAKAGEVHMEVVSMHQKLWPQHQEQAGSLRYTLEKQMFEAEGTLKAGRQALEERNMIAAQLHKKLQESILEQQRDTNDSLAELTEEIAKLDAGAKLSYAALAASGQPQKDPYPETQFKMLDIHKKKIIQEQALVSSGAEELVNRLQNKRKEIDMLIEIANGQLTLEQDQQWPSSHCALIPQPAADQLDMLQSLHKQLTLLAPRSPPTEAEATLAPLTPGGSTKRSISEVDCLEAGATDSDNCGSSKRLCDRIDLPESLNELGSPSQANNDDLLNSDTDNDDFLNNSEANNDDILDAGSNALETQLLGVDLITDPPSDGRSDRECSISLGDDADLLSPLGIDHKPISLDPNLIVTREQSSMEVTTELTSELSEDNLQALATLDDCQLSAICDEPMSSELERGLEDLDEFKDASSDLESLIDTQWDCALDDASPHSLETVEPLRLYNSLSLEPTLNTIPLPMELTATQDIKMRKKPNGSTVSKRSRKRDGRAGWRKYGQKCIKGKSEDEPMMLRAYFKCNHPGCPARKQVEMTLGADGPVLVTHNHQHSHPAETHPLDNPKPTCSHA